MDFYIIDQDILSALKKQGSLLPDMLEKRLSSITHAFHLHNISMYPESIIGLHKTYPFVKRNFEPHLPFFEISEKILSFVIKEKIKRVYLFTHSVYANILLHDLNNVGAEVFLVTEGEAIFEMKPQDSFLNSVIPLFFQHAQDYLDSVIKIKESELFNRLSPVMYPFRATSFDSVAEFLIIVPGDEKLKTSFSGKINEEADVLVFAQKMPDHRIHYANSVNPQQDYSFLLYQPLIGGVSQFMVSRKFYNSLSNADQTLLREDPNWVFYKNNAHVIATLLKTNSSAAVVRSLDYIDPDFERDYFHKTKSLFQSAMSLNSLKSVNS